jgi:hypothetical protein
MLLLPRRRQSLPAAAVVALFAGLLPAIAMVVVDALVCLVFKLRALRLQYTVHHAPCIAAGLARLQLDWHYRLTAYQVAV